MFDQNRRKYPRVDYPCQLTLWMDSSSNETILAHTANIGLGGLCVHLNQAIDIGTRVDVQLTFPNNSTPFKCRGTVVRSMIEVDKFFNTGIQFDPLDELKHAFLSGQVSELMDKEEKRNS